MIRDKRIFVFTFNFEKLFKSTNDLGRKQKIGSQQETLNVIPAIQNSNDDPISPQGEKEKRQKKKGGLG